MTDSVYITTPIYYVNAEPHVGSAYTTVIADVIARWHRLHGRDVYLLTGVDEHGQKQEQAAREAGLDPQTFVDGMAPRWAALWEALNISNDDFIRTTEPRHKTGVAPFMELLRDKDDIYLGTYEGWYCTRCEEFRTETELLEGNLCPVHQSPVERLQEENYFFRLTKYNDALIELYESNPDFLRPKGVYNEMYSLLKQGLIDLPVSRPTVTWGVPFPWDEGQVVYVWVEALLNYITAIGYPDERYQQLWPAHVHLMAKEIVRFHAVIWPAMLMSVGMPLPKHVFAHGWLLAGGEKISKSGKGITDLSPYDLISTYGVDGYRHHFVRGIQFGGDGNFSLEDMHAKYNAELANDLGNLASRTLNMIGRYCDGIVPDASVDDAPEQALRTVVDGADEQAGALIDAFKITDAFNRVWEIVREANRYLVVREPWKLAKDEANTSLVNGVLGATAQALATATALLSPVMPDSMAELWSRLGFDGGPVIGVDPAGNRVRAGDSLFPRLDA